MNGNYEFLSVTAALRIFFEKLAVTFVVGLGVVYILFNQDLAARQSATQKNILVAGASVPAHGAQGD